jgi:hypothetical protein
VEIATDKREVTRAYMTDRALTREDQARFRPS